MPREQQNVTFNKIRKYYKLARMSTICMRPLQNFLLLPELVEGICKVTGNPSTGSGYKFRSTGSGNIR